MDTAKKLTSRWSQTIFKAPKTERACNVPPSAPRGGTSQTNSYYDGAVGWESVTQRHTPSPDTRREQLRLLRDRMNEELSNTDELTVGIRLVKRLEDFNYADLFNQNKSCLNILPFHEIYDSYVKKLPIACRECPMLEKNGLLNLRMLDGALKDKNILCQSYNDAEDAYSRSEESVAEGDDASEVSCPELSSASIEHLLPEIEEDIEHAEENTNDNNGIGGENERLTATPIEVDEESELIPKFPSPGQGEEDTSSEVIANDNDELDKLQSISLDDREEKAKMEATTIPAVAGASTDFATSIEDGETKEETILIDNKSDEKDEATDKNASNQADEDITATSDTPTTSTSEQTVKREPLIELAHEAINAPSTSGSDIVQIEAKKKEDDSLAPLVTSTSDAHAVIEDEDDQLHPSRPDNFPTDQDRRDGSQSSSNIQEECLQPRHIENIHDEGRERAISTRTTGNSEDEEIPIFRRFRPALRLPEAHVTPSCKMDKSILKEGQGPEFVDREELKLQLRTLADRNFQEHLSLANIKKGKLAALLQQETERKQKLQQRHEAANAEQIVTPAEARRMFMEKSLTNR